MINFLRKNKYILFILLVSLLPAIPFFVTHDLLHSHDGLVHIPRLAAYYQALSDGHFPVRFAGNLNYGYGLPLFNFIYQFPYILGSLLIFIGFGLVNAFKISLVSSFIFSGIFMFLFGKEYFNDERRGLLVAVFYQFAPFRMVELLVRGSYGEVFAYTFLPLVLLGLVRIQNNKKVSGFLITAVSTALLVLSHNSVSLLFFGVCVVFLVITSKDLKIIVRGLFSLFIGILLSAYYWLPAILEHKYTYGNLYMEKLYMDHFVPIQNFFIPNLNNNPSLFTEGISTYIGLLQTLALILAIIVISKRKVKDLKTKKLLYVSFILIVTAFFFMLPASSFIWAMPQASLLRQFQFPWRFLSLIVVALAFMAVSLPVFDKRFNGKFVFWGVLVFAVLSVSLYWNASLGYKKIDENYYWNFPLNTTYYGETDVIWSAGPAKSYPTSVIEVISGNGEISGFEKKNHYHKFMTKSDEGFTMVSNTQYFPGWRVYADGQQIPIQFQDPNHRGLLVFDIPKGESEVLVIFQESKIRLFADFISLITLILLFPLAFLFKKLI